MEMVKVDVKLFVTCRLCLEEMGMYQITPLVQNQIKYCFDIDVDQFDGLPQLICGQCETILSDYFTKKRIFVGRQNALKAKIQVRKEVESSLCPSPPHEAVTSSQQNDNEEQDQEQKTTSKTRKRKYRVISSSSSSSGRASRAESANRAESASRGASSSRTASASRTGSVGRAISVGRAESVGRAKSVSRSESIGRAESVGRSESIGRAESVGRSESIGRAESVGRSEPASRAPSASRVSPATSTENFNTNSKLPRQKKDHIYTRRESWEANYTKKYACKLCKRDLKFGAGIANHIRRKHANLISKHKDIINKTCTVKLIKIDHKPNPTGSNNTVALSHNKIVGLQKENVYVFYTSKDDDIEGKNTGCSEAEVTYVESDDDEIIGKSKLIKRQRLLSKSSTDTVVLNDGNKSPTPDGERDSKRAISLSKKHGDAEIECINIDDSSNGSLLSDCISRDNDVDSAKSEDVEAIKTIVRACLNKYITKRQEMLKTDIKKAANKGPQLKRKLLNMGRKIINRQGFSCTGLLRFMENKNLDIKWVPMMSGNKETNYVRIMPRLKRKDELAPENLGWKKKSEMPVDGPEEILPKRNILPPYTYPNKPITFEMSYSYSSKNKTTKSNSSAKSASMGDAFQNGASKNSSTDIPAPKIGECLSMPVISDVSTSATISVSSAILNSNSDVNPSSDASIDKNIPPLEVSDTITETMLFQENKLLNANPVANPKQLPKKSNVSDSKLNTHAMVEKLAPQIHPESLYIDLDNDQQTDTIMHMPIITSTTSLAVSSTNDLNINTANKDNDAEKNVAPTGETTNEVEKPAPRIKVKPFSELMSDRVLLNLGQSQSAPANILTMNASTASVTPNSLGVIITQVTSGGVPVTGAQVNPVTNSNTFTTTPQINRVSVIMDTVELPNTKTDSPIRYFKNLLQIHNISLLESHEQLPRDAICLIKFKLQYLRENNQPVTLCLSVHCIGNIFAILVRDPNELNYIGLHQLSANWQWEVLKVYIYKNDVINKMLQNAQKISQDVYDYTKRFLCLLKSINFKKDESSS